MSFLDRAARAAVRDGDDEATFIEQAREAFRAVAGAPKRGRPAQSHGAWDPLIDAVGGQEALARTLGVTRRTLVRWIAAGDPSADVRRDFRDAASKK